MSARLPIALAALLAWGCAAKTPSTTPTLSAAGQAYVTTHATPAPSEPSVAPEGGPAPGPSSFLPDVGPSPVRHPVPNPALSKEQLLANMVAAIMRADNTVVPSPYPGEPQAAPIVLAPPVITSQSVEERTVAWIKAHYVQPWTGDLALDAPVWIVTLEGDFPDTALPFGHMSGTGRTHRLVAFYALDGQSLSMTAGL